MTFIRESRETDKNPHIPVTYKLNLWYKLSFTNGKILILDGIDGLRKL